MMRELATLCFVVATVGVGFAGPYDAAAPSARERAARPAAPAGASCGGRLGSNAYKCSVIASDGTTFTDCLRFASPGTLSDNFDLSSDQLGLTHRPLE